MKKFTLKKFFRFIANIKIRIIRIKPTDVINGKILLGLEP